MFRIFLAIDDSLRSRQAVIFTSRVSLMSNYRRSNIAGGTYFFTVNSFRRRLILTTASLRDALRTAIQNTRLTPPFEIDAWVLLPDHLHCMWTLPEGDANFSIRWSMIKRMVSQACADDFGVEDLSASGTQRNESAIWQRRFWEHQIRDNESKGSASNYKKHPTFRSSMGLTPVNSKPCCRHHFKLEVSAQATAIKLFLKQ